MDWNNLVADIMKLPDGVVGAAGGILELVKGIASGLGGAAEELPALVRTTRKVIDIAPYLALFMATTGSIIVIRKIRSSERSGQPVLMM